MTKWSIFASPRSCRTPIPFSYAPFSQILPKAAVFVHHGGIGTVAQALKAGVPQLVMPCSYDQLDNVALNFQHPVTIRTTAIFMLFTPGSRRVEAFMNRDPRFVLSQELEAKQTLLDQLRALAADDPDFLSYLIEGETNLLELIAALDASIVDDEILVDGTKTALDNLQVRKRAGENPIELKRRLLAHTLQQIGLETLRTPTDTLYGVVTLLKIGRGFGGISYNHAATTSRRLPPLQCPGRHENRLNRRVAPGRFLPSGHVGSLGFMLQSYCCPDGASAAGACGRHEKPRRERGDQAQTAGLFLGNKYPRHAKSTSSRSGKAKAD